MLADSCRTGGCRCECVDAAMITFGLDVCLIILVVPGVIFSQPSLYKHGVWGREPWALNVSYYLCWLLLFPRQSGFSLFVSYPGLEKYFRGWKLLASIVAVSPPWFSVIWFYFSKWLFVLCMKSFCSPPGFVWYEGSEPLLLGSSVKWYIVVKELGIIGKIDLECYLCALQIWNSVTQHLLYHKVRHLSLLKCHIFGCLTQRLPCCQALEDITWEASALILWILKGFSFLFWLSQLLMRELSLTVIIEWGKMSRTRSA